MAVVHQSDLTSYARCPEAFRLERAGLSRKNLSATVYGTVLHYVLLNVFEQKFRTGTDYAQALKESLETFKYYWHPRNIELLTPAVDIWLPRQSHSSLMVSGIEAVKWYAAWSRDVGDELLATEYSFSVPIAGTWDDALGEPHRLNGTIDRLSFEIYKGRPVLKIADLKGFPLDTPIATPTGWTTMADLRPGHEVFGLNGRPCVVTGKSKPKYVPCYRITFDDGTDIVADADHRWIVDAGISPRIKRCIMTTREMAEQVWSPRRAKPTRQLRIPVAEPLVLGIRQLRIDPYVLGAWLGDGKRKSGEIFKPDQELFDLIAERGYEVAPPPRRSPGGGIPGRTVYGLRTDLRREGRLFAEKHIPDRYLRASLTQRLQLLRGLMDTDGTWNVGRRQAVFTTTKKELADDLQELVLTLGCRVSRHDYIAKGFGVETPATRLAFVPNGFNPFALARKRDLVNANGSAKSRRRMVMSVERVPDLLTQCISVDSPDETYLAGHQMIPTHNSGKVHHYLRQRVQFSAYCYATTTPEFWAGAGGEDGFAERGLELHERFQRSYRRSEWVSLRDMEVKDAGFRGPDDYERFARAVNQLVTAIRLNVYPMSIDGDTCQYCEFRDSCGGIGVPDDRHGSPGER